MGIKILQFLKNKWVQLVLAFVIGAGIGVIFYPSKTTEFREKIHTLEETVKIKETRLEENKDSLTEIAQKLVEERNSFKDFREDTSIKIESLRTENSSLKRSAKRKKFRIVKPDGTIIEKEFEETSSEEVTSIVTEVRQEFDRKVRSIESKWKKLHKTRILKIRETYEKKLLEKDVEIRYVEKKVEREKIVKVNEKKLRTDLGYSTDNKIYTHASYPLWGPIYVGGGFSSDVNMKEPEARIGVGISW